jgi:hypothetical protein
VWEGVGVGATVTLTADPVNITITLVHTVPAGVDLSTARFSDRNVDVVMLSPNASDLALRLIARGRHCHATLSLTGTH